AVLRFPAELSVRTEQVVHGLLLRYGDDLPVGQREHPWELLHPQWVRSDLGDPTAQRLGQLRLAGQPLSASDYFRSYSRGHIEPGIKRRKKIEDIPLRQTNDRVGVENAC